jgi:hypothetical protein
MTARAWARGIVGVAGAAVVALATRAACADTQIVIDGTAPVGGLDHFFLPFVVPAGTAEIQVEHSEAPSGAILDWGVNDESGYRGWGGGLTDTLVINAHAASRCYVPGPLTPGTWSVVVGKALLLGDKPVTYHVVVTLRDAATLAPQTDRSPYVPVAPLRTGRRWYAGDLHTHSTESGDAGDSLDQLVTFAASMGLDFVEVSDHNTITQMDFFNAEQAKHQNILLVPGEEWTTYHGHGNGIGATHWVDHKIGQPGVTIQSSLEGFAAQGAVFSINHPGLALGNACLGCAWTFNGFDPELVGGVEIESRGYSDLGFVFSGAAMALWEDLSADGVHAAALGGSDDHQAGMTGETSHISNPTTYVLADELSAAGILQGIKERRTFVKLNSPADPAIDLESSVEPIADTVTASSTVLKATVTGADASAGAQFRWIENGVLGDFMDVTSDPFVVELSATPHASGADRVRAEVFVAGKPTTVTSYLWLQAGPAPAGASSGSSAPEAASSSGCSAAPSAPRGLGLGALSATALAVLVSLQRRRRSARRLERR